MIENFSTIEHARDEILWWEFCCLLHDIGKLSDEFLHYRQVWHKLRDGYSKKDPHDHKWLDRDDLLEARSGLKNLFHRPLVTGTRVEGVVSVVNAVHNHIAKDEENDYFGRLLRTGDGIDSQYDRNNPLVGCEQTNHRDVTNLPEVYRSNVFGHESAATAVSKAFTADPLGEPPVFSRPRGVLHRARGKFYDRLEKLLEPVGPGFSWNQKFYREIRSLMRRYMEPALSDTTRPNNDTSLWEHVYSVTTIAKAAHAQVILRETKKDQWPKRDNFAFTLWGVGFDSLRYISTANKIRDVAARRWIIQDVFNGIADYVEFECPLGNEVYRDESSVVFLICDLPESEKQAILRSRALGIAACRTKGEILPASFFKTGTRTLTALPGVLETLRGAVRAPVRDCAQLLKKTWLDNWREGKKADVCPVCRWRPVERNRRECGRCIGRRRESRGPIPRYLDIQGPDAIPHTVFTADIQSRGRVALIVARLGLDRWLDGSMVRTLFVTEPDGIDRTLEVLSEPDVNGKPCFADIEDDARSRIAAGRRTRSFEDMVAEINGGDLSGLLYGRGIRGGKVPQDPLDPADTARLYEDVLRNEPAFGENHILTDEEKRLNAMCTKTPTPSTILDVWISTQKFFESIVYGRNRWGDGGDSVFRTEPPLIDLPELERKVIETEPLPANALHENEAADATIDGSHVEVVYRETTNGRSSFELLGRPIDGDLAGRHLTLFTDGPDGAPRGGPSVQILPSAAAKGSKVLPWRPVAVSPDLLMVFVPADQAIEITRGIYRRFRDEFGKVDGRLPLSIGNIVFPEHLPMFSVLDAARRMVAGFRRVEGRFLHRVSADGPQPEGISNPPNGEMDYLHPWHLVQGGGEFETVLGPVVHASRIAGRTTRRAVNLYDCVWLGSSAARFGAHFEPGSGSPDEAGFVDRLQRLRAPEFTPVRLEDLEVRIEGLWEEVRKHDLGPYRRLVGEYEIRKKEWRDSETALAVARSLGRQWLGDAFDDEMAEALKDGWLARALWLHLHAMKDTKED